MRSEKGCKESVVKCEWRCEGESGANIRRKGNKGGKRDKRSGISWGKAGKSEYIEWSNGIGRVGLDRE